MKLEPLMTIHTAFKDPVPIGRGPFGVRIVWDISGGSFEGERLRGTILPSGGAWILSDPEGIGRLDVRLVLETHDGAYIYVQYYGVVAINDQTWKNLSERRETEYGDSYFMAQLHFETGSKRYQWLNLVIGVAEGRLLHRAIDYRVYGVMNDQQQHILGEKNSQMAL